MAESGLNGSGIDALGDVSVQTYVAKCDENEQHVATLYCLTCTTNLCAPCADAIHSTKVGEDLVQIRDMNEVRTHNLPRPSEDIHISCHESLLGI